MTQKTNIYQRAGVLRPRACCACAWLVVSLLLLSTMVSMKVLKVYLSLYTLLRSHLFVNCCIRRYLFSLQSRSSHCPPITGLLQVPVGAEGSAPFHSAAVFPTLDSQSGLPLGLQLRERARCVSVRFERGSVGGSSFFS